MKTKIPTFKSDKEAEDFVDTADLTQYDLSGAKPVRFEFEKKEARVNMRLPEPLLEAVKDSAKACGIPYQRFIREAGTCCCAEALKAQRTIPDGYTTRYTTSTEQGLLGMCNPCKHAPQ